MAYQNTTVLNIDNPCQVPVSVFTSSSSTQQISEGSLPSGYVFNSQITFRANGENPHGTTDFWVVGNSDWGIKAVHQDYAWDWHIQFWLNGTMMFYQYVGFSSSYDYYYVGFAFGINTDTQKGSVVLMIHNLRYSEIYSWAKNEDLTNNSNCYNWIVAGSPITYNWQSVPSISGKNGILSLVTLDSESINDGEPVSGAAVSVFDQAPSNDNNIKNLADTYGGGEASSAVDVTVKYKVTLPPGGSFSTLKIVAKKDSIPNDVSDGDKIVDISPSKTKKTVTGLDENSLYYFKIFAEDSNGSTSESDEKHIMTSGDEGWSFDYTGEIQTFVAPKTGIYQLETWGAQGGNATDGTLTARGGYGAYAKGEAFLTQGDTLYINVGGQNGYGGGGNFIPPDLEYIKNVNNLKLYRNNTFFEVKEQTECWGDNNTHTTEFDASSKTSVAINNADYTLFHTEAGVVQASDPTETYCFALASILNINLVKGSGTSYTAEYSTVEDGNFFTDSSFYNQSSLRFVIDKYTRFNYRPYTASRPTFRTSFTDLTDAIEYIYANFAYINLYVDGALWVEA